MKTIFFGSLLLIFFLINNPSTAKTTGSFQDIISQYLELKNGLVSNDNSKAATSAASLMSLISSFDTSVLDEPGMTGWKKYSSGIEQNAKKISEAENIEQQREYFSFLSNDMYSLLKVIKGNTSDLYYQYCPMARNDEGAYWISESSKIRNPYFGKKMMSCGETKKTIKAE